MKIFLSALLLFFSTTILAQQTVREQFEKITTLEQAQKYIDANPALKPAIMKISYGKDTSVIAQRLLKQNKGEIFHVGYVTYKILEATESVQYRASYVFLDGGSLTVAQVDSLKNIIVQKANQGAPFEQLSDQYTMDGNNTKGDTGWFFGEAMVPKELQDAVKNHKTGEIFFVDVPDKQWHYIVKKTFDDDLKKDITVLKSNGR